MSQAKAFCPGHITGFFEICRTKDLLSTGSRGAGLCLTLGATSSVSITPSAKAKVKVSINGKPSDAPVTRAALGRLVGDRPVEAIVSTNLDLPISQGFAMSAAGALSSSIAAAGLLHVSEQKAFEAAHIAEIDSGGGLGDVSALLRGGITIREKAGLPPRGKVRRIDGHPEVVLCVVGRAMLTKRVLENPTKQKAINSSGSKRVDELLRRPTLESLMELSYEFATESRLASGKVLEAVNAASKLGMASMSMLGNSVFAIGDTPGLERVLSDFGDVYTCKVDTRGPRLLR